MKNKESFLREPPEILEFRELFKFAWVQGVGNQLDSHGQPEPWTNSSLEGRFYEFGYEIDGRTIQNWLSGTNKPSASNIHRLARIIGNDEVEYKRQWRDAFTIAKLSKIDPVAEVSAEPKTVVPDKRAKSFLQVGLILVVILTFNVLGLLILRPISPSIQATNLKFCDDTRFSKSTKTCMTNVSHFPQGTELIFVSFNLPGAQEGQLFERKWFRKGQLFLSKESYFDATWEDYTWLQNPEGHDQGRYNLQIIVNEEVTTGTFFVGEDDGHHVSP